MRRESCVVHKERNERARRGEKRTKRENKDTAKSKTAGNINTRRKKRSCTPEAVDDFTRDINFSLKLARQDSPRGGDQEDCCLASKRHERGVGTAGKKRRRSTPAKRTSEWRRRRRWWRQRGEKEGGSDDGGRKVPWRNSLRVSMARYRRRRLLAMVTQATISFLASGK